LNIDSYLAKRIKVLNERSSTVRDFKVFDFSYVPKKLLIRGEAEPIIDSLLKYSRTGIAQNLIVLGSRGCGKTLLMKYLEIVLKSRVQIKMLYGNCRNHNTSFKLLARFLGAPSRGHSIEELYARFEAQFAGPTVVVLDEVDLISKKDPNKDILYFLSRSERSYMVICLSNNPRLLGDLDSSVRSSLQAEVLYLKNYDAQQISKILTLRAQAGLRQWQEQDINKISALTVQRTNSDVRVAIKTLFYLVAGSSDDISENFDRARRDIFVDLVSDLNNRNLLILKSAQLTPDPFVKQVYENYQRLSEKVGESSFSYVYFLNNLSYMQSLGLVLLMQTKVNRSYTSTVSLLFDGQVLDAVFKMRFR